jgi:hypothetical protein
MNNFNFGEVLTRAWKHIWKHKVLWVFGILASCARGGGGGGNGGGGNRGFQTGSGGNSPFAGGQVMRVMSQVGQYIGQHWWIIVAFVIAIIFLSFISYSLGMIGRVGMIKGTSKAEKGAENISFGEIWSESLPYFWRVFGLNFLIGLAIFAVIIVPLILLGVIFATGSMAGRAATAGITVLGFVCLIPIFCLLIPIGWILSVIIEQAQAAIVLEDLGMLDGFKRGWQIVKKNAVPMIIMFLILGIGGAVIGVIVSLPLIFAFIPILVGLGTLRQSLTPIYISLACCVVYLPVLIFLNGILTAYIQSAWALTFMQLAQPKEDTPIIIEANA